MAPTPPAPMMSELSTGTTLSPPTPQMPREATRGSTRRCHPDSSATPAGETVFDLAYGSRSADLYITGMASENFQGQQNAGALDIYVGRLDPALTFRWIVLFGSEEIDEHPTLDVHEPSDRVYVSAETQGAVDDQNHTGAIDVFAAAFDTDGDRKWTRTLGSPERDRIPRLGRTLVADASGMYLPVTTRGTLDGRDLDGFLLPIR